MEGKLKQSTHVFFRVEKVSKHRKELIKMVFRDENMGHDWFGETREW